MARKNKRFEERLAAYKRDYNVDDLNNSNDRALLYSLIGAELILEDLQDRMQQIVIEEDDLLEQAQELKRLSDLIRDTTNQVTTLQKTLSIDRKSRRQDQTNSVDEYIRQLKSDAYDFVNKRLIKIYCPDCKIMVARYSPVHDHTAFIVSTECSQCGKAVRANRDARDIWFDVKDADWRRQYPVEIVQPKLTAPSFDPSQITESVDDEIIIDAEMVPQPSMEQDSQLAKPQTASLNIDDMVIGE